MLRTTLAHAGRRAVALALGVMLTLTAVSPAFADDEMPGMSPTTESPACDRRVELGRLLAEHGSLAIIAMRAGLEGRPDFEAAANTLESNTADLQAAITSVYGEDAGNAFGEMWRNHIGFFVDYTVGLAEGDQDAQQQALDRLAQYRADFSQFLASANPNLEASALAEGLQVHVNQLVGQIDAYDNGDYASAYEFQREATAHLTMTGSLLAGAIVVQFPDQFAPDMPDTSTHVEEPTAAFAAPVLLAVLIAAIALGLLATRRFASARIRE